MGMGYSQDHAAVHECMVDAEITSDLVTSLDAAGFTALAKILRDKKVQLPAGNHTVFAPTNDSFKGNTLEGDFLINALKYHVVPNRMLCRESLVAISKKGEDDDHSLQTWYGKRDLWVYESGAEVYVNGAKTLRGNHFYNDTKKGVSGVIIGIDQVLLPCGNTSKTLEEALAFHPLLKAKVIEAGLLGTLTAESAMFTVFAPPDAKLAAALGQAPIEAAKAALLSHTVDGCFTKASLLNMLARSGGRISIQNLHGGCLQFELKNGQVYVEVGKNFVLVEKEAQHPHGVVHDVTDVLSDVECKGKFVKKRTKK